MAPARLGYNRHMRLPHLGLALTLLLLAGCPRPNDEPPAADTPPQFPVVDEAEDFGALMQNQQGAANELKRLQRQVTDPPRGGLAGIGLQDQQFTISSRLVDGRAGLAFTDNDTGEVWTLWGWADQEAPAPEITVIRDEPTMGGYLLEFNLGGAALTVALTARWVQGRYLQVNRELLLGGLDHELWLPADYTTWVLEGPWLPYRMLPGERGPWGVVPDRQADGQWHARGYPAELMCPALAAYDGERGFLLSVADDHPLALDRAYDCAWRVDAGRRAGEQLSLAYRVYDPTQDRCHEAFLPSGLPLRDSIALEPFLIHAASVDPTLVYAETAEIITLLVQMTRVFQYVPQAPGQLPAGSVIVLDDWAATEQGEPGFIERATGLWDVSCALAGDPDSPPGVPGTALGTTGATLQQLGIPVLGSTAAPIWFGGPASGTSPRQALDDAGVPIISTDCPGSQLVNIRAPQVATEVLSTLVTGLAGEQAASGYLFGGPMLPVIEQQSPQQGPYYVSHMAAEAMLRMRCADAVREAHPEAVLGARGGLSWALPAYADIYLCGSDCFRLEGNTGGALPHANRLANLLSWGMFGVSPRIAVSEDSLAQLVIATTPGSRGHLLRGPMQSHAGFEELATHQPQLREAAGELLIVHSAPQRAAYTGGGERPAECEELVAVLPASFSGAQSIWIAFHGRRGQVEVDSYNNLSVSWTGGFWETRLPPGYWKIEHPSPDKVQAGDAVLIRKQPLMGVPSESGTST